MTIDSGAHAPKVVQLSYQLIRNITSPDEAAEGVKAFIANLPAFEVRKLGTEDNLRSYIPEYSAQRRNRVHDAIRDTIINEPRRFITRNSGFAITASDIDVDDQKKVIRLKDASIINGAQSRGEIMKWIEESYDSEFDPSKEEIPFFVRAEIVIDPDREEVVETAIARNTATPVRDISQAGARGHLDELEASIQKRRPDLKIQKSETDQGYDTRKILQYTRLLMPISVSRNDTPTETLRAYKNPAQCLTDFSEWYEARHRNAVARAKYEFTVRMAPYAIEEYEYWERHEAWNGHRLWEQTKKGGRACRRDKANKIIWISPGLVFPILGAMREFVVEKTPGHWTIEKPPFFKPAEMIGQTVKQFRSLDSDPMQMGRSAGAYDALRTYPGTLVEVMKDLQKDRSGNKKR